MSNKRKIPFDKRGGVIVVSLYILKHKNYLSLSPQAKVLMQLMQEHWRDEKEIDYGIREAAEKIPCSRPTAMKAVDQLDKRGFIRKISESMFSSRTESRTRSWKLTWMPFLSKKPTNDWENWVGGN